MVHAGSTSVWELCQAGQTFVCREQNRGMIWAGREHFHGQGHLPLEQVAPSSPCIPRIPCPHPWGGPTAELSTISHPYGLLLKIPLPCSRCGSSTAAPRCSGLPWNYFPKCGNTKNVVVVSWRWVRGAQRGPVPPWPSLQGLFSTALLLLAGARSHLSHPWPGLGAGSDASL